MTISVQWERLDALLADGLADLAQQDFQEIEEDTQEIPLDIDWDHLKSLERLGTYGVISAREKGKVRYDGKLVGYNAFFVNRHTRHRRTVFAFCDALYLIPDARKGTAGIVLLQESDRLLREAGVVKVQYGIKDKAPVAGRILERLGYRQIETAWSKLL